MVESEGKITLMASSNEQRPATNSAENLGR